MRRLANAKNSPAARCLAYNALEDRREMRLRLEARRHGDIDQPIVGTGEKLLGRINSTGEQEIVGTHTSGNTKLRGEMHRTKTGNTG